jgi:hypothetical protein
VRASKLGRELLRGVELAAGGGGLVERSPRCGSREAEELECVLGDLTRLERNSGSILSILE